MRLSSTDERVRCISELSAALINYRGVTPNKTKTLRNFRKDLREFLDDLGISTVDADSEIAGLTVARHVVWLALQTLSEFKKQKQELALCDFDDIIRAAHESICADASYDQALGDECVPNSAEHLESLRKRFRHFLVDEFQDTDTTQWEILWSLARPAPDSTDRTVFIVGDPKQAIYSFRGGDVRVFTKATEDILGVGGVQLSLVENLPKRRGDSGAYQ